MAKQEDYLSVFGIYLGLKLEGYELENISFGFIRVERFAFQGYVYPTILVWRKVGYTYPDANRHQLLSSFSANLRGHKTIYTIFGNAFYCEFASLKIKKHDDTHVYIEAIANVKDSNPNAVDLF
uniref:Uncharacterized protein n=1 Tax=Pithovirus LCPAC404 TaxID=2506597 RepID=A0A481ZCU2_9VIRU|nr:MAG: uncharacterized protein LCPAC404_02000 [Pithovirus LCPAC404]